MTWLKTRKSVQMISSMAVLIAVMMFQVSLWIILGISVVLGVLFGKTFCKWMCPLGLFMEATTSKMTNEALKHHMYNYYKLGCPISWIQGFLNRFSLFKIKRQHDLCTNCGRCDQACYIPTFDTKKSLYKKDLTSPSEAFSCSKCLACVDACPTKALKVTSRRDA